MVTFSPIPASPTNMAPLPTSTHRQPRDTVPPQPDTALRAPARFKSSPGHQISNPPQSGGCCLCRQPSSASMVTFSPIPASPTNMAPLPTSTHRQPRDTVPPQPDTALRAPARFKSSPGHQISNPPQSGGCCLCRQPSSASMVTFSPIPASPTNMAPLPTSTHRQPRDTVPPQPDTALRAPARFKSSPRHQISNPPQSGGCCLCRQPIDRLQERNPSQQGLRLLENARLPGEAPAASERRFRVRLNHPGDDPNPGARIIHRGHGKPDAQ